MKCTNCGRYIPDSSVFCPKCGVKIDRQAQNSTAKKKTSMGERVMWGILAAVIGVGLSKGIPAIMNTNRNEKNSDSGYSSNKNISGSSIEKQEKSDASREFQDMAEKYGITHSLMAPLCGKDQVSDSYMLYCDNPDIPYVEVIDMIRDPGSDVVSTASFSYYYLLGAAGYTDKEGEEFIESVVTNFQQTYDSDYTYVEGDFYSLDRVGRITVSYLLLEFETAQKELTSKGLLDCTGGISFRISDQSFLNDGYTKK